MQENKPILIIGLGNPGRQYEQTRHNAGFMAADFLAGPAAVWKKEKNALVTKMTPAGSQTILIAKPQTYMNDSGIAVRDLMAFYKIPLENLIVIHDDMDLPIGTMRQKVGGGSAGHNGIKSIDANVGNGYMRIRLGIGHPPSPMLQGTSPQAAAETHPQGIVIDPSDWVLGRFSADDLKKINEVIRNLSV